MAVSVLALVEPSLFAMSRLNPPDRLPADIGSTREALLRDRLGEALEPDVRRDDHGQWRPLSWRSLSWRSLSVSFLRLRHNGFLPSQRSPTLRVPESVDNPLGWHYFVATMSGQQEMSPTRKKRAMSETRKKVLALSTSGLTPREIAAALQISTQAVYRHLKALNGDAQKEAS